MIDKKKNGRPELALRINAYLCPRKYLNKIILYEK